MRAADPEKALAAIGATATKHHYVYGKHSAATYRVRECPNYAPGGLTAIPEIKTAAPTGSSKRVPANVEAKYDLTCPYCGKVDTVKVAWMQSMPPEEWYCRCTICRKPYAPRKKEEPKLTPHESTAPAKAGRPPGSEKCVNRIKFDADMSKEKYLEGVGSGQSDWRILKNAGLDWQTFKNYLTRSKRDWGLGEDFNFKKSREGENMTAFKTAEEDQREKAAVAAEEYTISQLIDLRDGLSDDIDCLDRMLGLTNLIISNGVKIVLERQRCESTQKMERINDLFDTMRVAL